MGETVMSATSPQPAGELQSEFPRLIDDWDDWDALPSRSVSLFPATASEEARLAPRTGQEPSLRPPSELKDVFAQLGRKRGPGERRAILLALLLTPQSARERQAWSEETASIADALSALRLVQQLPSEAQPAMLERVLLDSAAAPAMERIELLRSVRRLMCADGKVRPIDRLRWLLIRHVLARPYGQDSHTVRGSSAGNTDLAVLAPPLRQAVAHLTAFLARIVPMADPVSKVGTIGVAWYRATLRPWWNDETPPCELPDGDQLVQAIVDVRTLSWMQRPVLVRTWVDSAIAVARRHRSGSDPRVELPYEAAEALRLASRLLDTPLPPALARCFIECPDDAPTEPRPPA
jgi:hypothetical protein